MPSAGGDWEVELGRAESGDGDAGPVLFDEGGPMDDDGFIAPMEVGVAGACLISQVH